MRLPAESWGGGSHVAWTRSTNKATIIIRCVTATTLIVKLMRVLPMKILSKGGWPSPCRATICWDASIERDLCNELRRWEDSVANRAADILCPSIARLW